MGYFCDPLSHRRRLSTRLHKRFGENQEVGKAYLPASVQIIRGLVGTIGLGEQNKILELCCSIAIKIDVCACLCGRQG